MAESFIGTCFMCGDPIPTGTYCSESCRKEHESIIEARPCKESTGQRQSCVDTKEERTNGPRPAQHTGET